MEPSTRALPGTPLFALPVLTSPAILGDETDEHLVLRARRGDPPAFDELVRRHAPRIHAVARRMVGAGLAPDVVQETFVAAYRSLGSFRGHAALTTWLHRIAVNQCLRHLHRARTRPVITPGAEQPAANPLPHEQAEAGQFNAALERALDRLPVEFRLAFTLREIAGLDYREMAAVMRCRPGTVKSRLARARELLRRALRAQGYEP
jgi:RNA polymerase sigma-70 factor (ECF subfamily)